MSDETVAITVLIDNVRADARLRSQWGLSFWVQTAMARVLFDSGASRAFMRNARQLGVPLETVDAFVLSHGHFDHGGGIDKVAGEIPRAPFVLHPGALVPRYWLCKTGKREPIGLPERSLAVLREQPGRAVWALGPTAVAPGVWASGPVPRRHPLEEAESNFFFDDACTIRDHVVDDQGLWIETPRGLVVLCGCAHAGVINTVEHVRAAAHACAEAEPAEAVPERARDGVEGGHVVSRDAVPERVRDRAECGEAVPERARDGAGRREAPPVARAADGLPRVRAVLGGFHLLRARKERLQATADYLAGLDLELCAPCHCTGKRATGLLRERLGEAFVDAGSGCRLTLE